MDDPIEFHRKFKGKLEVKSKVPIKNKNDLSLWVLDIISSH